MRGAFFFLFLVMSSPSHAMLSEAKIAIKNFIKEARMPIPPYTSSARNYYHGIFKIIAIEAPVITYCFPYPSLFINGAALCLLGYAYIKEINSDTANRRCQRRNALFQYESLSVNSLYELAQADAYGNSDHLSLKEQNTGFLVWALGLYTGYRISSPPHDGAKYLAAARIFINHHADTKEALQALRREQMHEGSRWLAIEIGETFGAAGKLKSKII